MDIRAVGQNSAQHSFKNQPIFSTVGHSGVSEYRRCADQLLQHAGLEQLAHALLVILSPCT